MLYDAQRVLQLLTEHVSTKESHGRGQLLAKIAELTAECRIEEGEHERAFRLAGALAYDLRSIPRQSTPAPDGASRADAMGQEDDHPSPQPEGSEDGHDRDRAAGAPVATA